MLQAVATATGGVFNNEFRAELRRFRNGAAVYARTCAMCHGPTGECPLWTLPSWTAASFAPAFTPTTAS